MVSCSVCGARSVTHLRYSGQHLCAKHFKEYFERRFARGARGPSKLRKGDRLAVAVSGGKDSVTMLRMARAIFHDRTGIGVEAIIVDEGIRGYRKEGIRVARRECASLGVPLRVVSFKDMFGRTLDEAAALDRGANPCSYCGVWRRAALNRAAKESGAVRLLLGHNLDDTAESLLMNFVRGDVARLARMGPHDRVQPGLVPRLMPLRAIPEEEVKLYSILEGMKVLERECPYAVRAHRGRFVKLVAELEDATPGTRHAMLSGYDQLRPALVGAFGPAKLGKCRSCGEPSLSRECMACEMMGRLDAMSRHRRGKR